VFHAFITLTDQSQVTAVEVSGDAVPYDLQILREQLLQLRCRRGAVTVRVRAPFASQPWIRAQLADLDRHGVTLDFTQRLDADPHPE
jgi:hypothetical protein